MNFFFCPVIIRMRLCMHWRQKKKKKSYSHRADGDGVCRLTRFRSGVCVGREIARAATHTHGRRTKSHFSWIQFEHREKERISADGFGWRVSGTCDRRMCRRNWTWRPVVGGMSARDSHSDGRIEHVIYSWRRIKVTASTQRKRSNKIVGLLVALLVHMRTRNKV